jgi:hypothetical protein
MHRSAKALGFIFMTLAGLAGCARGGADVFYRSAKHFELHVLRFHKDFTAVHEDVDRYFFRLDERDPDSY